MSEKDRKDQYLLKIGRNEVLVIDENMGLCLCIYDKGILTIILPTLFLKITVSEISSQVSVVISLGAVGLYLK